MAPHAARRWCGASRTCSVLSRLVQAMVRVRGCSWSWQSNAPARTCTTFRLLSHPPGPSVPRSDRGTRAAVDTGAQAFGLGNSDREGTTTASHTVPSVAVGLHGVVRLWLLALLSPGCGMTVSDHRVSGPTAVSSSKAARHEASAAVPRRRAPGWGAGPSGQAGKGAVVRGGRGGRGGSRKETGLQLPVRSQAKRLPCGM